MSALAGFTPISPGSTAWLGELTRGDKGPHATVANAVLAICSDTALAGLLAFDEFLQDTVILSPPPVPFDRGNLQPGPYPRPIADADVTLIQGYLQRVCDIRIGQAIAHQAVETAAQQRRVHPVRDYLASLTWDGVSRLDRWLCRYLGAEQNGYTAAVGRMFLVSTVARVFKPGCKVDHMPVLEGPQGSYKSQALAILGGQWFSDSLPDLHSSGKDVSVHLRGGWIIEIAELSSLLHADQSAIKSFLTRTEERYRPPYGRQEVTEPRQCVLIGSTNEAAYLRDATGGRRFWPIKTGTINLAQLRQDRDQLFAEATALFRQGVPWWPDRDTEALFRPEQEARYQADAWEAPIAAYLAGRPRAMILDIANSALSLETGRLGTAEQRRITACLARLGWEKAKRTAAGAVWTPTASAGWSATL